LKIFCTFALPNFDLKLNKPEMYAIVDIAGQQFKVEKGQELFVHRIDAEEGARVDFNKVMLIDHEGKTTIGTPVVEGAVVEATVLEHLRGDKLFVFKKKRRKGFKKFNGHRQYLSLLKIENILETGKVTKSRSKKTVAAAAPAAGEEAQVIE
jgi:large subunit ribosomal protein L21